MDADGFPNPAPINVWVISGPYILLGIAEIFAEITAFEYAFTKVSAGSTHPKLHSILSSSTINRHFWLTSHSLYHPIFPILSVGTKTNERFCYRLVSIPNRYLGRIGILPYAGEHGG